MLCNYEDDSEIDCPTSEVIYFLQFKYLVEDFLQRNLCFIFNNHRASQSNSAFSSAGEEIISQNGWNSAGNSLEKLGDPIECLLCKEVVKEVEKEIKGPKTKEKIQEALQKVCSHLHKLKNCSKFVNKYSDKLIDLILKYESAKIVCSQMALCLSDAVDYDDRSSKLVSSFYMDDEVVNSGNSWNNAENSLELLNNPIECLLCKEVVKEVEKEIEGPKTKEKIQKALLKVCSHLHKLKNCSKFVKKYAAKLIDLILKYGSSKIVCSQLALCLSDDVDYDDKSSKLLASFSIDDDVVDSGNSWNNAENSLDVLNNPIECLLCKEVVKEVEKEIEGPKTKEKIQKALLKVCSHLHKLKNCSKFVKKYADKLIDLILKYGSSKIVCSQLALCLSDDVDYDDKSSKLLASFSIDDDVVDSGNSWNNAENSLEVLNNPIECLLCKEVVKEVEKEIEGPKTKEKIQKALLKVCSHLHKLKNCSKFVKEYADKLIDLIIKYESSKMVCSQLALCLSHAVDFDDRSSTSLELRYTNAQIGELDSPSDNGGLKNPLDCMLCKVVVKEVLKEVKKNKTKENIQKALLNVCKHLHKFKKCSQFVKKYSVKLIDFIIKYGGASEICLMFCIAQDSNSNSNFMIELTNDRLQISNLEDSVQCGLCKILRIVFKMLEGPKSKSKILRALHDVCKSYNKFNECEEIIKTYSEKLTELIINYNSAEVLCSNLRTCNSKGFQYDSDEQVLNSISVIDAKDFTNGNGNQVESKDNISWNSSYISTRIVCDMVLNKQFTILNSSIKEEMYYKLVDYCVLSI